MLEGATGTMVSLSLSVDLHALWSPKYKERTVFLQASLGCEEVWIDGPGASRPTTVAQDWSG